MARNCPDCATEMTAETITGVTLDACSTCAGIWFDAGEMKRVMQSDPIALIDLDEDHMPSEPQCHPGGSTRRCPNCERVMDRIRYMYDSPIQLDSCETCFGLWVEHGELCKMQEWL